MTAARSITITRAAICMAWHDWVLENRFPTLEEKIAIENNKSSEKLQ